MKDRIREKHAGIEDSLSRFAERLSGRVLWPRDGEYDEARKLWNGMVDKRPGVIVRCAGPADVVRSVQFAREHDLEVSVRGGGHSISGLSVSDGGMMIDLSQMKGVQIDQSRGRVRAEPGLKLGEFDLETQAFGLATTMGIATDTGIAGLTLGGGYGWLAGRFGLACDNLLSVQLATAEGEVVRANAHENADLFWAVRGGGGNFGIVTSFEYQLHPVGQVLGGVVLYPLTKKTLLFYDEFSKGCGDEVSTIGLLSSAPDGSPAFVLGACHCGPLTEAEEAFKPLRKFGPPIVDMIQPRSYVEMQRITDEGWPPGRIYYWKSSLLRTLEEDAIETLLEYARKKPTALSLIYLQQLHGAAARVGRDETAFPHRFDHFNCGGMLQTESEADVGRGIAWSRGFWEAMQPYYEPGNYANDLGEEGEARVQQAYGPGYVRLQALKQKYDPANVFRLNQNVKPAA